MNSASRPAASRAVAAAIAAAVGGAAVLTAAGASIAFAPPAHGAAPAAATAKSSKGAPQFAASDLADIALKYTGEWGGNACADSGLGGSGQCKMVVNCLIVIAGGRSAADGDNDYAGSYLRVGGVEVKESEAVRGTIIQWGGGYTGRKHTAIVLANKGKGNFKVVDSNWVSYEQVGVHTMNVHMDGWPDPVFITVGRTPAQIAAAKAAAAAPAVQAPASEPSVRLRSGTSVPAAKCLKVAGARPIFGCQNDQPALLNPAA